MTPDRIAATIDHTILKAEATPAMVDRLCEEAGRYGFVAVCVNPMWVGRCRQRLAGTAVRVASVVGFPLGANRTELKVEETRRAIGDGAVEIDMVIPVGALIAGETALVRDDIAAVAEATHAGVKGNLLKVILETAALSDEQIITACRCAVEARADFVKTSTGFHSAGGAKVEHVRLMKRHAAPLAVKASGGIRSAADMMAMLEAGASRIGTSSGPAIMDQILQGK
ncbi:MAG TPA: deoxyribose-phosphate aldolase [Phycisphaerae bacterium]|nr:deoxyribose-phosphate aldolase [Phycisphaerae bacterium]